ncbi:MAG: fibronectin type III domain-containing protein, partial [candidate division KSB1 bacterium]|nr:fibronectin type III domain-containing protein [candidate division KSB1 bacterium]
MGAFYFNQKPVDQTPPAVPQGLTVITGDRQITIKWRRNTEADFLRYRIYGGTASNPRAVVVSVAGVANTSKTIAGLINGTRYYYRLTAVDGAFHESGFSNEVSATPKTANLPPQNLRATAGIAQVTLTWNANTEANFLRYRIYGGTSANPTT